MEIPTTVAVATADPPSSSTKPMRVTSRDSDSSVRVKSQATVSPIPTETISNAK